MTNTGINDVVASCITGAALPAVIVTGDEARLAAVGRDAGGKACVTPLAFTCRRADIESAVSGMDRVDVGDLTLFVGRQFVRSSDSRRHVAVGEE